MAAEIQHIRGNEIATRSPRCDFRSRSAIQMNFPDCTIVKVREEVSSQCAEANSDAINSGLIRESGLIRNRPGVVGLSAGHRVDSDNVVTR